MWLFYRSPLVLVRLAAQPQERDTEFVLLEKGEQKQAHRLLEPKQASPKNTPSRCGTPGVAEHMPFQLLALEKGSVTLAAAEGKMQAHVLFKGALVDKTFVTDVAHVGVAALLGLSHTLLLL